MMPKLTILSNKDAEKVGFGTDSVLNLMKIECTLMMISLLK